MPITGEYIDEEGNMIVEYRLDPKDKETPEFKATLERLRNMRDEDIDFSDIPETTEEQWATARLNPYIRHKKKPVTLRLGADILWWLKRDGPGYQTRAREILRQAMEADYAARSKAFLEKMAAPKRKPAKTAAVSRKPAARKIAAKRRAA